MPPVALLSNSCSYSNKLCYITPLCRVNYRSGRSYEGWPLFLESNQRSPQPHEQHPSIQTGPLSIKVSAERRFKPGQGFRIKGFLFQIKHRDMGIITNNVKLRLTPLQSEHPECTQEKTSEEFDESKPNQSIRTVVAKAKKRKEKRKANVHLN